MNPEERLAAKLIAIKKLKPPIPVEDLLSQFADIEYDHLPAGSDAVLLRKQINKNQSLVIIDRKKPLTRRRFTLAHELGHILIPWHIGTISCHTFWTGEFGVSLYRSTEAEANRFASELLMPTTWMREVIAEQKEIADIWQEVRHANVSEASAGISLCKALPTGFVFLAIDPNNNVIASAKSAKTAAPLMKRGDKWDRAFYDKTGAKCVKSTSGGTTSYWWDFTADGGASETDDARTSREILEGILKKKVASANRKQIQMQINGIIGAANGSHKPSSVKDLVFVLRQRFAGREPQVLACVSHPDFGLFLRRRAEEIIEKSIGK